MKQKNKLKRLLARVRDYTEMMNTKNTQSEHSRKESNPPGYKRPGSYNK